MKNKLNINDFLSIILKTALISALLASGCRDNTKARLQEKEKLINQQTSLKMQLAQAKEQNAQLRDQVAALSAIENKEKLNCVSTLEKIDLTNRTGFYDTDHDSKTESLVVYIRPVDETGDIIKAPGSLNIQLWNLHKDPQQALLKQWTLNPDQLKQKWAQTFLTNYYHLKFDITTLNLKPHQQFTLKAVFTDYLTGKVLTAQTPIEN